ncbi:unnamed protein product [Spodoptera exigua]|nr:unnamed protein product [Spodoptera exigua]
MSCSGLEGCGRLVSSKTNISECFGSPQTNMDEPKFCKFLRHRRPWKEKAQDEHQAQYGRTVLQRGLLDKLEIMLSTQSVGDYRNGFTGVIPRPYRKPAWNDHRVVFRHMSGAPGGIILAHPLSSPTPLIPNMQYFMFELYVSIRDIQRSSIWLAVMEPRCCAPPRLMGEATIDLGAVWSQPHGLPDGKQLSPPMETPATEELRVRCPPLRDKGFGRLRDWE